MGCSALSRRLAVVLAAAGLLAAAPAAGARDEPRAAVAPTGGVEPGKPPARGEKPRRSSRRPSSSQRRRSSANAGRPILGAFTASQARAFLYGRTTTVRFRVTDRSRRVRMRLDVVVPGRRVARRIDLGARRTGVVQSFRLAGRAGGPLPQGRLELRLSGRDPGGKVLRSSKLATTRRPLSFFWHHFPLRGNFPFGAPGSRFGSPRPGHLHQGQDIAAPEGTPVLVPRGGRVRSVAYQAGGAGHYVVLTGASEKRDYVFMHLQAGSVRVRTGQYVPTGAHLGNVGTTGASEGPHLHFEIWAGPWQAGGRPTDPFPHLVQWDRWS